jgi:serine phosphatase RsbU (regulator of sigma subunit)
MATVVIIGVTMLGGFLSGFVSALAFAVAAWRLFEVGETASGGLLELAFVVGGTTLAFYVEAGLELRARGQLRRAWLERTNRLAEELAAVDWTDDPAAAVRAAAERATAGVAAPPAMSTELAAFLRAVGDQSAQALERADLQRAEQRARADLEFLATASVALASSLEVERVVAALDDLAVPYLADECWLTLAPQPGRPPHSEQDPGVDDDERSCTIELHARGHHVGWLTLKRHDRSVNDDERAVAAQLAERAAQALDHALLFAEQATTSSTLEHSLLPDVLLPVEHLQVAARYLAAVEGHAAGGDFYDALSTPGGSAVLLVGDVQGKGVGAATLTSVARHTLRAGALGGAGPAKMLHQLNEALLYGHAERVAATGRPTVRFVTAAVVQLTPTPTGFQATVAAGGHPPPLVIHPDGTVDQITTKGALLGVFPEACFHERTIELELSDTLVLYTDGVVEQRDQPELFDELQLGRLVRNMLTSRQADDIAQVILDTVVELAPREARDDIALLVARVTGPR